MLEVLGEAAVSIEPGQRALDDPAARKNYEALGCIGPFHDLDGPFADPPQRVPELVASVAAVGNEVVPVFWTGC